MVATPIVSGLRLFITQYYTGAIMFELDPKQPRARMLWKGKEEGEMMNDTLHSMISTPVIDGDTIRYGHLTVEIDREQRAARFKVNGPASAPPADDAAIHAIERPHRSLWTYYILSTLPVFPLIPFLLPYLYFGYHTMRYKFTDEGISMSWGILFRRQIINNYARI